MQRSPVIQDFKLVSFVITAQNGRRLYYTLNKPHYKTYLRETI